MASESSRGSRVACPAGGVKLDEDGGETCQGGADGEDRDHVPPLVLQHRLPPDVVPVAISEHPKAKREIESDADIPSHQHGGDNPPLRGQHENADETDADGAGEEQSPARAHEAQKAVRERGVRRFRHDRHSIPESASFSSSVANVAGLAGLALHQLGGEVDGEGDHRRVEEERQDAVQHHHAAHGARGRPRRRRFAPWSPPRRRNRESRDSRACCRRGISARRPGRASVRALAWNSCA